MKTKKIILTLALGSLMIWPATAQNSRRNAQKQRVQQMKEIVKELDLDDNQTALFTELYTNYQTALDSLSPAPANRGKNREKQEELTEEQASEKLTQQLDRELQRATLKKEFCEKLQKNGFTSVQILKSLTAGRRADATTSSSTARTADSCHHLRAADSPADSDTSTDSFQ